jgi:hypothetical protein
VTNLYVRDSLLSDMNADEQTQREMRSVRIDSVGKVFIVVGQNLRQCLVCEGVFTRQASREHAEVPCHWVQNVKLV